MTSSSRGSLTSVLVLAALSAGIIGYATKAPPRPLPTSAPDSVFSAERAMAHVRAMAERPHPPGSVDHARVRDYVMGRLKAFGVDPQVQQTTALGTRFQEAGWVENVMGRLPGTRPGGPAVLLAAHYDGVGAAPAASDDASGSSVLLETLRALKAGSPLEHDVIFLFTDGEEAGLLGAAAFVAEHPWAKDVEAILNFEARGTGGQAVMFQTGPGNLDQIRLLKRLPNISATSLSVTVYQFLPNDTDLSEFFTLAKPGLNFAYIDGVERYHTAEDDADHIDPGSVQQEGTAAVGMARAFGHGPLPRPKGQNAIFFDLPLLGLVVYPESWARPIAVVTMLLSLAAIVRVARRERRWLLGLMLGLLATIVTAALGGAAALGWGRIVPAGVAAPGIRGIAAIGLAFIGLGTTFLCWAIIRRWVGAAAAALGPLLLWTGLAAAASWKLPGLSFAAVWPAIAAAAVLLVAPTERPSWAERIARWLPAAITGVLIVPVLYVMGLIALGLVGAGGIAVGALVPIIAWLLAPNLDEIAGEHRWRTAFAALGIGLVAVAGSWLAGGRAAFPSRSLVAYAETADGTDGWLVTPTILAGAGSWGAAVVGPDARSVTPDGPDLPNGPPRWLTRLLGRGFPVTAAPAPRAALAAPAVTVTGDSITPAGRRITLRVGTAPGTTSVGLRVVGAKVQSAEVDGRVVDPSRYRYQTPEWQLTYWGPGDAGFTVSLVVAGNAKPSLEVMAQTSGLPGLPGRPIPPRPAGVLPTQSGDLTMVYRRVSF